MSRRFLGMLLLLAGTASPVVARAEEPFAARAAVEGTWEGNLVRWEGTTPTLHHATLLLRHEWFGPFEVPSLGCQARAKREEVPPAALGDGFVYSLDPSRPGSCGAGNLWIRIRQDRAEVIGEEEGRFRPAGTLLQYRNTRAELAYEMERLRDDPARLGRGLIIKLVRSMKWPPALPDEARDAMNLGNALLSVSEPDAAAFAAATQHYKDALVAAPWWADAYYNLALCYEAQGHSNEARLTLADYLMATGDSSDLDESYAALQRVFLKERARPAPMDYAAWGVEVTAYVRELMEHERTLERERDEHGRLMADYKEQCLRELEADEWVECKAFSLKLTEWGEHIDALAADLERAGAAEEALVDQGFKAYNAGDYERTLELIGPLAQGGDFNAQYLLGRMILNGEGVNESRSTGIRWLEQAASNGSTKAKQMLRGM